MELDVLASRIRLAVPIEGRIPEVNRLAALSGSAVNSRPARDGYVDFANPDEVKPAVLPVKMRGDTVELSVPKQAIIGLELQVS